jgi:6-phosphogluconolactonase (cycloisomerase 2 family)
MTRHITLLLVLLLFSAASAKAGDEDPVGGTSGSGSMADIPRATVGELEFVDATIREDWKGITSIVLSPDQQYAYVAAFDSSAVYGFQRDSYSGRLELIQALSSPGDLNGVTSLRLSSDGRYAVSAAFRSNAVTLFRRDPQSGELKIVDRIRGSSTSSSRPDPFGGRAADPFGALSAPVGATLPSGDLRFVIEAVFVPDSRDIYALGCNSETVVALRVTDDDRLKVLQVIRSQDKCFANARGIAITPDGRSIYVAAQRGDSLTVLERDPDTGKAEIRQVCRDGQDDCEALDGAFSAALSPEADMVYVASGNFGGDDAISVYRRAKDGTVQIVQELFHAGGKPEDFQGGNELIVSPDGRNVYALGTGSDTLVSFRRDAKKGTLALLQTFKDEIEGTHGLENASGLTISADGKFVYVVGNDSVAIFRRTRQPLLPPP